MGNCFLFFFWNVGWKTNFSNLSKWREKGSKCTKTAIATTNWQQETEGRIPFQFIHSFFFYLTENGNLRNVLQWNGTDADVDYSNCGLWLVPYPFHNAPLLILIQLNRAAEQSSSSSSKKIKTTNPRIRAQTAK